MKTFVIYEKDSRNVLACFTEDCENYILRNDVEIKVYNDTEPVFTETNDGIKLNENAFTIDNIFGG